MRLGNRFPRRFLRRFFETAPPVPQIMRRNSCSNESVNTGSKPVDQNSRTCILKEGPGALKPKNNPEKADCFSDSNDHLQARERAKLWLAILARRLLDRVACRLNSVPTVLSRLTCPLNLRSTSCPATRQKNRRKVPPPPRPNQNRRLETPPSLRFSQAAILKSPKPKARPPCGPTSRHAPLGSDASAGGSTRLSRPPSPT